MQLKISIITDTAGPALQKLMAFPKETAGITGAAGRRLIRDTSAHVRAWGASHPNKLGGRRTNYWSGIANKINPAESLEVTGNTATVSLGGPDQPGLLRALGPVTIVPGTKTAGVKYLAIPARAEAYGKRPGEFNNLTVFWGRNGPAGLKQIDAQKISIIKTGKRTGQIRHGAVSGGLVMYWFKKSITQPQDRSLLPSDEEFSESVNAGAAEYADLRLKQIMGGS